MSALDPATIANLLKEEALRPTGTGGGRGRKPKVDLTGIRELNVWMKLSHHLCTPSCEHRTSPNNPTSTDGSVGNACWNPNCEDHKRDKATDRGTNVVVEVKGQYICRYCFLAGYLSD